LTIRILLGHMPPLLEDIVRDVLGEEPGMYEVRDCPRHVTLGECIERDRPQVVIVRLEEGSTTTWQQLLRRAPELKVLGLHANGRRASLYEMRPTRTLLGEATAERLRSWVRTSVCPMALETRSTNGATPAADATSFSWSDDPAVS